VTDNVRRLAAELRQFAAALQRAKVDWLHDKANSARDGRARAHWLAQADAERKRLAAMPPGRSKSLESQRGNRRLPFLR